MTHGFDPAGIDMREVFATWDMGLVGYFVARGADMERRHPLAHALCERVRTAVTFFKHYKEQLPALQAQADRALRYHCREGNGKWVSLLLWAGADPYAPGEADADREADPEDRGISALSYAALYGHGELLSLKQIRLRPDHPEAVRLAQYAGSGGEPAVAFLRRLLQAGRNSLGQVRRPLAVVGEP